MLRSFALISLLSSVATGAASQTTLETQGRVAEILQHLETFMPETVQGSQPLVYTLEHRPTGLSDPQDGAPLRSETGAESDLATEDQGTEKARSSPTTIADEGVGDDTPSSVKGADAAAEDEAALQDIGTALDERLGAIDFGELARDAQIVPMVGQDMMDIPKDYRADALHNMARTALLTGKPAAFRKVMAAYVDPAWGELSDSDTALQMIAWMPDTAAFLGARLAAAKLAGAQGALARPDQDFLWKDLRARVERVGSEGLTTQLLEGMLQTGFAELAIETIKRRHASGHERITTYVALLDSIGPDVPAETLARLVAEIEAMRGDIQSTRYDPNAIALSYWKAGLADRALDALAEEADPALRLRTRFEMLLESSQATKEAK